MNHAKTAKYHQCLYVYKYVDQKGLAAVLATEGSAGVTREINVGNPLHAGEETCKSWIHHDFEI